MRVLNRWFTHGSSGHSVFASKLRFEQLEDRLVLCSSPGCVFVPNSVPTEFGSVVDASIVGSIGGDGETSYLIEGAATGSLKVTLAEGSTVQEPVVVFLVDPTTNQIVATAVRAPNSPTSMPHSTGSNDSIGTAYATGLNGPGLAVGSGFVGDGVYSQSTGDYDFYVFTADANQKVTIDIDTDSMGQQPDTVVAIYDMNGTLLGQNDDDGLTTDSFLSFVTPAAGDYYVVVFGKGSGLPSDPLTEGTGNGTGSMGDYEIAIEILNPLTATAAIQEGQSLLVVVQGASPGDFTLSVVNTDAYSTPNNSQFLVPSGGTPDDVLIADVNGDGIADLLVADDQDQLLRVLLGNGDGTFEAPSYDVIGAGTLSSPVPARALAVGDFDGDARLDVAATNPNSADVSVLAGEADRLEFHRRFDAARTPGAIAVGDFNGDGIQDLIVADVTASQSFETHFSVLLGRGDGTFTPQLRTTFDLGGVVSLTVASLDGNLLDDVVVFGRNGAVLLLRSRGDGTFETLRTVNGPGPVGDGVFADLNGDGYFDLAGTLPDAGEVFVLWGMQGLNFGATQRYSVGQRPVHIAVADVASPQLGAAQIGQLDSVLDLIVTTQGNGATAGSVVVLAGDPESPGGFGYTNPLVLAQVNDPRALTVGDLNDDAVPDIVVAEQRGLLVYFPQAPTITPNTTQAEAMELGTLTHLVLPIRTISSEYTEAWFTFTVPVEDVDQAGDQVVDLSALFENESGAGLQMEVYDSSNNLIATGSRLRLVVPQGERLTVRISGAGTDGTGAYTLAVDVLPQVVTVEAVSLLTGTNGAPAGPVTSLVVTLQGDYLDRESAQDPNNYTVTFLGADGVYGTADDQVIPIGALGVEFPIVYTPNSNVNSSSGQTLPDETRQTVTLNFAVGLPAGSYVVALSPNIRTAAFNPFEDDLLADLPGFNGHPVVSVDGATVAEGSLTELIDLVLQQEALDLSQFTLGNSFLTQLHGDLSSLLDAVLTELGDAASVTDSLINQLQFRIAAGLGQSGSRETSLLVLLLDPVSINLVDPNGSSAEYDLQTNSVSNSVPNTFVEVAGNVELIIVADALGAYNLQVKDVPTQPRGVLGFADNNGTSFVSLTDALRSGTTSFEFVTTGNEAPAPPTVPTTPNPPDSSSPDSSTAIQLAVGLNPLEPESRVLDSTTSDDDGDVADSISDETMEDGSIDSSASDGRRNDPRASGGGLEEYLREYLPRWVGLWEELMERLRTIWLRILRLRGQ